MWKVIEVFLFFIFIFIQCEACKRVSQEDLFKKNRDAFVKATYEWAKKRLEYKEAERNLFDQLAVLDFVKMKQEDITKMEIKDEN